MSAECHQYTIHICIYRVEYDTKSCSRFRGFPIINSIVLNFPRWKCTHCWKIFWTLSAPLQLGRRLSMAHSSSWRENSFSEILNEAKMTTHRLPISCQITERARRSEWVNELCIKEEERLSVCMFFFLAFSQNSNECVARCTQNRLPT